MIRAIVIATIVLIAILTLPHALTPGVNSADLIVWAAPLAVVYVGGMPRRRARRPRRAASHWIELIDENHPDALGSFDLRERGITTVGGDSPSDRDPTAAPPAVPPRT